MCTILINSLFCTKIQRVLLPRIEFFVKIFAIIFILSQISPFIAKKLLVIFASLILR